MRIFAILLLSAINFSVFGQNEPVGPFKIDCQKSSSAADIDSAIYVGKSNKVLIYCSPKG